MNRLFIFLLSQKTLHKKEGTEWQKEINKRQAI